MSVEEIIIQLKEIQKSNGRIFDQQFFASNEAIDNAIKLLSRPKGVWVGIDEEPHEEWECSNCGNIINTYMQDELEEYEYCHKCGAKMSPPRADMRGKE